MHELAITETLLELALKHAEKENAVKVTDLYITVGVLTSIVDDSVQFYWDIISKKTKCENATLHFERIAAAFRCEECGEEYPFGEELEPCPKCKAINVKIISGEEFFLNSISIERQSNEPSK